jgi:hypothetical protein
MLPARKNGQPPFLPNHNPAMASEAGGGFSEAGEAFSYGAIIVASDTTLTWTDGHLP